MTTDLHASPGPEWRNWLANHLGIDRAEVYDSIAKSANLRDATYWVEIVLSAGIATLGLILGSPGVIIGAMLISPLMGPIMGAGLALAAGDLFLAVRTTVNIGLSCLLAIGLSILLVALLPFREMTSEIAARTQPNTLDLVVRDIRERLALGEGDVRLRWVPARTTLAYPPRQTALEGEREEELQNFTDMLRRYPQLRAVLQVQEIDQTATQRSSAIVQALAAAGVQPRRVRIEEAGGNVGGDEVGVVLEPRE